MDMMSFIIGFLLGILLTLPIFPDPYHEDANISFWLWLYRELDEMIYGEKK